MPLRRRFQQVFTINALTIFGLTAAAYGGDIARVMPCDTAIYVGWAKMAEPDSAEMRMQQKYFKAARDMVAEKLAGAPDERATEQISMLMDVLPILQTASVGLGVFDVTLVDDQPDIQAALVIDAGAQSAVLAETMRHLIATADNAEKVERHTVRDVSLECFRLGESPMHIVWGVHEPYFILAVGDVAAGKVLDCIAGKAANLADTDELTFDRQKVKAQVDGRHFCAYIDVRRVITRAKEIATQAMTELPPTVEPALAELGLKALRSKYVHLDTQENQPRCAAFAHVDGPLKGLLKIWDQKPLTDDDLKIVPKNAYWAEVCNSNLALLWEEAMRVMEAVAPDQVPAIEGALAMPARMLGFSLTDDLLPVFGDTWALFDAPSHGGILLSGTVLVADVKDANTLQGMLARVVELATPLAAKGEATLKLKETKYGNYTIHYVLIGGVPSPVAPAWAFQDGRWVFALFPQTVATALKQIDPKSRGESLLDNPDFQAARARLPKDAQSVGYVDSKYFARMFYPLVTALQTMGASMVGKHGGEIDLALVPPLSEAATGITNYVGTASNDKDGILYAGTGSGAQPVLVAAGGTAMATSILLPSLARAREVAKRAVSASNLKGIGMACMQYAAENQDKFPASLDVLLKSGSITQKQLHSPRDPDDDEDTVSYAYIDGQTTGANPQNVLAYERVFDHEGTNVLFLDGHVEWMKLDPFRAAVRETYGRLDRKLPADFDETSSTPTED